MFLAKDVLEHPCRSVISIKLLHNFIEIARRRGCYPVILLHIFRTLFLRHLWRNAFRVQIFIKGDSCNGQKKNGCFFPPILRQNVSWSLGIVIVIVVIIIMNLFFVDVEIVTVPKTQLKSTVPRAVPRIVPRLHISPNSYFPKQTIP